MWPHEGRTALKRISYSYSCSVAVHNCSFSPSAIREQLKAAPLLSFKTNSLSLSLVRSLGASAAARCHLKVKSMPLGIHFSGAPCVTCL